jgi:adenosylmethionine-8-amino-7-oxononanoate aminotransferase
MMKYAKDHNIDDLSRLCILGFENGYHGNSIGTLSCSDPATNLQKLPTFDWPRAPYPKL